MKKISKSQQVREERKQPKTNERLFTGGSRTRFDSNAVVEKSDMKAESETDDDCKLEQRLFEENPFVKPLFKDNPLSNPEYDEFIHDDIPPWLEEQLH